ncbi:Armadillo-type fold [Cynara cardunculus var. scolymus]|uniref:Armadillo-type fold n=1 Tax=Cynara cardunculus var. scolymus TaxID=59895 RepID=A0A118K089_CYNCS|nr:Armadillo-type fold [Cynara cardunculus var. scolymus]
MFWRMTGLSTVSPVDTILDKGNFTLEELLDEDEIIQECKALNSRLINFLRERTQVEQLVRYIIEEAYEDAANGRTFKFPFIACEIFTCEVDIILKALVEDEELMNLLFSFLEPEHPHKTLLAGYFSKVVACLMFRKSAPLMNYIQAHPYIIKKLVDLVGITSIMEVLIRLIGADEHLYTSYADPTQWLEDIDVLEMIVDKFSSSDCPEVHANAAESLCAIARYAPPGLAAKISTPSFIARLFHHALEESRPRSVLVYALSVCICLLDPKRLTSGMYYIYNRQLSHGSAVTNPETLEGMLESLGNLLKLLDVSAEKNVLPTTYGKLQPPLGKHRLKIVEFISVLMTVGSEAAEKELIRLGVLRRILEYPYNNFIHHDAEQIVVSCLESKNVSLVEHILEDCNLVRRILDAERNSALITERNNVMDISEWVEWHTNVLLSRNELENVFQWACGRPTAFHDRGRDSEDDDYHQDKDYDVAVLANNLSQAFRYGICENDDNKEANSSLERDNEDIYFDDESGEVVISSLGLGDDQESGSLFANSNWFAFEEEDEVDELATDTAPSSSPNSREFSGGNDDGGSNENDKKFSETTTSESKPSSIDTAVSDSLTDSKTSETDKPPEWVEWRDSVEPSDTITEPAGTSESVTNDPPKGGHDPKPVTDNSNKGEVSPSCTTDKSGPEEDDDKGKSDISGSPPDTEFDQMNPPGETEPLTGISSGSIDQK